MNTSAKKILQLATLFIFFSVIVIYVFFRSEDLILGVKIKDVSMNGLPAQPGTKVTDAIIEIAGNADHATNLTLDGREISIDENGNFKETIALLLGYNIINIKARDKFGYTDEKNYKLIYETGSTF